MYFVTPAVAKYSKMRMVFATLYSSNRHLHLLQLPVAAPTVQHMSFSLGVHPEGSLSVPGMCAPGKFRDSKGLCGPMLAGSAPAGLAPSSPTTLTLLRFLTVPSWWVQSDPPSHSYHCFE